MGSIYKKRYRDKDGSVKDGNVYWIKYYRNGKACRESAKSDKEHVAKRLLKLREGKIAEGAIPNLRAEKTTYDDLLEDIKNDYKVNGLRSADRLGRSIKHLTKFFTGMRACNITADLIKQYISRRLQEGYSNATVNRELAALKRMFNLGLETSKVLHVPKIKTLEENNRRTGFFEVDEFLALRAALPEYLKPVTTMAYYYGMRKEEILSLEWNQVDLREGEVRLNPEDTKNKEPRLIILNDEMYSILVAQKRKRDLSYPGCPYVFFGEKGDRIKDFRDAWDSACKRVGLEGRVPHDFRRTAVRNMVRAGVPERVSMMISGHKTRSVFDRYNISITRGP